MVYSILIRCPFVDIHKMPIYEPAMSVRLPLHEQTYAPNITHPPPNLHYLIPDCMWHCNWDTIAPQ